MRQDRHGEDTPERSAAGPHGLSRRGVLRAGAALGLAFAAGVGADAAHAGPATTPGTDPGEPQHPGHLPGWDMQNKDDPSRNTHLWIVVKSLDMLRPLTGPEGAAAKILLQLTDQQQAQLHQGIWDADDESPWNDYGYAYHFYNPETNTNYWPCWLGSDLCKQTARVWGRTCFDRSLAAYQERDYGTAVYYLGLSLHYLTDLSQPMHAANFTAGDPYALWYHTQFESYAITWTNKTNPPPIPYQKSIESDTFEGYIDAAARFALQQAKLLLNKAALAAFQQYGTGGKWASDYGDPVIQASLSMARSVTSQYLLMWIQQALSLHPAHTWSIEDVTARSGGPVAMTQALAAVGRDNDRPEKMVERVFSVDQSNQHFQVTSRQPDGSWQTLDMTTYSRTPAPGKSARLVATTAGMSADPQGTLGAFVGSDRNIYAFFAPAGATDWQYGNVTKIVSAPPVRDNLLWAYSGSNPPTEQLVFVDDKGHVNTIYRLKGGKFQLLDLTATITNAPPMDGMALSGSAESSWQQQTVVYLDSAGHVHELGGHMTSDDVWKSPWHADLTEIAKAPPAAKQLIAGSTWYAGYTKQVAYVGPDGHIYELSVPFTGDKPWIYTDVTAVTNAPPVEVVALIAFEWASASEKHIVYLDQEGHVHDIACGPRGWQYVDLTQYLQAPVADGTALAGYERYLAKRLGITFVDQLGHIHDIVATAGTTAPAPA